MVEDAVMGGSGAVGRARGRWGERKEDACESGFERLGAFGVGSEVQLKMVSQTIKAWPSRREPDRSHSCLAESKRAWLIHTTATLPSNRAIAGCMRGF